MGNSGALASALQGWPLYKGPDISKDPMKSILSSHKSRIPLKKSALETPFYSFFSRDLEGLPRLLI